MEARFILRGIQQIIRLRIKNFFTHPIENKFLFVLSPPFCGSTLITEALSKHGLVSCNNRNGTREGQRLPFVNKLMFLRNDRWNPDAKFDWEKIKWWWFSYWDRSKLILLEKSPPNIIRALDLERYFEPAYFILFIRNPYAHCQSLMTRNGQTAKEAAEFTIECMNYQKFNLLNLKNVLLISYEDFTQNKTYTLNRIKEFIPELDNLLLNVEFNAHNFKGVPLTLSNLNQEKISKLSQQDLNTINKVFSNHKPLLNSFGYSLM